MNTAKLNNWLQGAASVAVLLGLGLVALEIRENNAIARDETLSEIWHIWISLMASEYGPEIGSLHIKSINNPESLSDEEMFKLSSWLTAVMSTYGQLFLMHQEGRVSDDYRSELADDVEIYLANS